jgi:hypothetical protein
MNGKGCGRDGVRPIFEGIFQNFPRMINRGKELNPAVKGSLFPQLI